MEWERVPFVFCNYYSQTVLITGLTEVVRLYESVCYVCDTATKCSWMFGVCMSVYRVTFSPPGFLEPAFIQLWQIVSQHLLMAGLVIIRKAINTPSLFNWFEFMAISVLSHSRSHSPCCCLALSFLHTFCLVCMFNTQLFQHLLSGQTVEYCFSMWQQTDVNVFIV